MSMAAPRVGESPVPDPRDRQPIFNWRTELHQEEIDRYRKKMSRERRERVLNWIKMGIGSFALAALLRWLIIG